MTDMDIAKKIPDYVSRVMNKIYASGEKVYIVGGSLRDIMLGNEPKDFDLAISSPPERTMEIFSDMRVIATGLKHGTVTVISDGNPIEITTFRVDGDYKDSRHPDRVSFTSSIEDDLSRRDFTVNAMAFSEKSGVIDPFGGKKDLERKIIRAVGDPKKRFSEDALRIMRAFRFSANLSFSIEENTLSGAAECRNGLKNIARERIATELIKLLSAPSPKDALILMRDSGVLSEIVDGYEPNEQIIEALSSMTGEDYARLGFFLCGAEEKQARDILNSLRCSNKQITGAMAVWRGAHSTITDRSEARRLIGSSGIYASDCALASVLLGSSDRDALLWVSESLGVACTISDLAVNGSDLMAEGISGKEVGRILRALLEAVIEDPEMNDRYRLLEAAKEMRGQQQ